MHETGSHVLSASSEPASHCTGGPTYAHSSPIAAALFPFSLDEIKFTQQLAWAAYIQLVFHEVHGRRFRRLNHVVSQLRTPNVGVNDSKSRVQFASDPIDGQNRETCGIEHIK